MYFIFVPPLGLGQRSRENTIQKFSSEHIIKFDHKILGTFMKKLW